MRVLLAEDDVMIGEAFRTGLRRDGIAVDWVRDGVATETALAAGSYDLPLLDPGLPAKPGLQVLRGLRSRGAALPVVVITAHDAVADRVAGRVSPREFALLQALLERPGRVLSRAQLEDRLYGWGEEVESNVVEVHIHSLRRKLGAELIRNVRGVAYRV